MTPEQVVGILALIGDLRVQLGNVTTERDALRETLAASQASPAPPPA